MCADRLHADIIEYRHRDIPFPAAITHFLSKSANLDVEQKKEDVMAKGNNARKKETKKPKKDKK